MNDIDIPKLKSLLEDHDMKHKDLCDLLNLTQSKVSNMMVGARKISDSEQKLLKLYFYGIMPFEMLAPADYSTTLSFTKDEWRVLDVMAKRSGFSDTTKWIVQHIREYLAFCESQRDDLKVVHSHDDHLPDASNMIEFRYYGQIAAGTPCDMPVDESIMVASTLDPSTHVVFEVCGESGTPKFQDGDRWIIDTTKQGMTATKGKPAVFSDENGNYLKVFNGGDSFSSVNPNHKDLTPGENLKLVGYPVEKVEQ